MTSSSPDARRSRLDFWQACTGFLLALFICVHLLLKTFTIWRICNNKTIFLRMT